MSQPDFARFLASLQYADSPHLSPERMLRLLGVKRRELAEMCRVRTARFRQSPTSPEVQSALRELVRVLGAAYDRFEDEQSLVFWFKNCPIAPLEFHTPAELCVRGRAREVLDCLITQRC